MYFLFSIWKNDDDKHITMTIEHNIKNISASVYIYIYTVYAVRCIEIVYYCIKMTMGWNGIPWCCYSISSFIHSSQWSLWHATKSFMSIPLTADNFWWFFLEISQKHLNHCIGKAILVFSIKIIKKDEDKKKWEKEKTTK